MRISDWSSDVCSSDLGWRRVGGNRDDQRQSNHRLFDTSHPYSTFLCAGGIRPPRCFDQIFTSRSRSELAITLTDESAIAAAAMIGDNSSPKTGRSEEHTSELQPLMRISSADLILTQNNYT